MHITGRFVLITLIVFFGIIIGINVLMMKLAIQTLPGTEVDSPYAASLAYGQEIAAAQAQAARGWAVNAHLARNADGDATLNVDARDHSGAPLRDVVFTARLERPADRRLDRVAGLDAIGGGVFRDVAAGQWNLVLEGEHDGMRIFTSRNRVILK